MVIMTHSSLIIAPRYGDYYDNKYYLCLHSKKVGITLLVKYMLMLLKLLIAPDKRGCQHNIFFFISFMKLYVVGVQ